MSARQRRLDAIRRLGNRALDQIVETSPQSQILMVGQRGTGVPANGFPFLEELIAAHPEVKTDLTGDGSVRWPLRAVRRAAQENSTISPAGSRLTKPSSSDAATPFRMPDRRGCQRRLRRGVGEPLARLEPPQRSRPSRGGRTHLARRRGHARTRGRHRLSAVSSTELETDTSIPHHRRRPVGTATDSDHSHPKSSYTELPLLAAMPRRVRDRTAPEAVRLRGTVDVRRTGGPGLTPRRYRSASRALRVRCVASGPGCRSRAGIRY